MQTFMEDRDDRDRGQRSERDSDRDRTSPEEGHRSSQEPIVAHPEVTDTTSATNHGSSGETQVVPPAQSRAAKPEPAQELRRIEVSPHVRPQVILSKVVELLLAIGAFLSKSGKSLLLPTQLEGVEIVKTISTRDLPAFLVNCASFYTWGRNRGEKYLYLSGPHASALFQSDPIKKLPTIEHVVRNCAVDKDLQLLPHGYSPESRVYLCGPVFQTREGTRYLDEALSDFRFRNAASRANFIGALLGTILFPRLKRQPPVCIAADGPGAGKSHLGKVAAVLVDGVAAPVTVGINASETEFEKTLGAHLARFERVILVDNCRGTKNRPALSSSVLERLMTDERPSTRKLGSTSLVERPADMLWIVTANDPQMSPDLVSRCIPVVLRLEANRTCYSHPNLLEYVLGHREEILGELLGMIVRWREQGAPLDTTVEHRELHWAQAIGGLLKANGINGFLENYLEAMANQNTDTRELVTVLRAVAQNSDVFESMDIAATARGMRLLRSHFWPLQGDAAARSKVSVLLRPILDVPFEFEGSRITVTRHLGRPIRFSLTEEELLEDE
ncbi:MAG: hypothetical protein M5U25_13235 [Planctomycetota bacterium]|nr:hypothetical protein [Planctomycetota bacterium]